VHTLASDSRLPGEFIRAATGDERTSRTAGALLSCQCLPGERLVEPLGEVEVERRGLPDAWVYDSAGEWAYAIECKLGSTLTRDQLERHAKTLRRRFNEGRLLAITADREEPPAIAAYRGAVPLIWLPWTRVYDFLSREWDSERAHDFTAYMRLIEDRLMAVGSDVQLTTFTGVPFGPDKPYNPQEARAVLRTLHREVISSLRARPKMRNLIAAASRPSR
jgi:hypothetical protein